MSFYQQYQTYRKINFRDFFSSIRKEDIEGIIDKEKLDHIDFLKLLSPAAEKYLELMANKAHQLTVQHFGKVVLLYAPLYLANYCDNKCVYCGFNLENNLPRKKLSYAEVAAEAAAVANKGFRHILLLTGGSRSKTPVSYIKECISIVREYFSSISIEIYALKTEEYRKLIKAGVDGLTIYQEVYDEKTYKKVHLQGPKKNYRFRLEAAERGCKAGMRNVNLGALLGLNNWHSEVFFAGLHAYYLQHKYPETQINLSIPRLQPHLGNYQPESPVSDSNLVQILLAFRLFLPRVGLTLSTREPADLRNHLLPLGITKMSAESSTKVGGYTDADGVGQFDISDQRQVSEIKKMLLTRGYQPVFQDWYCLS